MLIYKKKKKKYVNVFYVIFTILCLYIFLGDRFLYGVWDSFTVHPLVFNH